MKDLYPENTYKIFKEILEHKYPTGLPLLPNTTGGATLLDVYPEEYKQAQTIAKRKERRR